jgi:hypothetical protein
MMNTKVRSFYIALQHKNMHARAVCSLGGGRCFSKGVQKYHK